MKQILIPVLSFFLGLFLFIDSATAQVESDERALIEVKDGISISKDSLFRLNLRFRMQNRFGYQSKTGEFFNAQHFEARVRRLRLRFDGFVINKRLQYYIQLSFSRADQNLETGTIAQTVRDAILYYHFNNRFYVGFGQSKLPGNRQRVTSSGNLQFADRSIANTAFNIDRDFGFFGYYTIPMEGSEFNLKAAITSGDGRNASPLNNGLAYTGRIEWLPLGAFAVNTDYMEGDLDRTPTPKLSLGATYSFNNKAVLSSGQTGSFMRTPQDIQSIIADAVFKYNGIYFLAEYFNKRVDTPVLFDPVTQGFQIIQSGQGVNTQLSYTYESMYEPSIRYARVFPVEEIRSFNKIQNEIWLGISKYLNGHRVKAQANLIYFWLDNNIEPNRSGNNRWSFLFQVEFGI